MSNYWDPEYRGFDDGGEFSQVTRSWSEVWQTAITSPSLEAYRELLRTANITVGRAVTWMFAAWVIVIILSSISQAIWGASLYNNLLENMAEIETTSTTTTTTEAPSPLISIICSPFAAGIGVLFWLIFSVGIPHVVASGVFGGRGGDFAQLAFLMAAYQAPIAIINGVLGFIPILGALASFGLGLYALVLGVISVEATYRIGWFQSIIAFLALPLFICGCLFACFFLVLAGSA